MPPAKKQSETTKQNPSKLKPTVKSGTKTKSTAKKKTSEGISAALKNNIRYQIEMVNKHDPNSPLISMIDWTKLYQITCDSFFQLAFTIPNVAIKLMENELPPEELPKLDLNKLEVQNGILGECDFYKKSAADLIYIIPYKNSDQKMCVSVILEHKTRSERMTIFQLTRYCVHLMEKEYKKACEAVKSKSERGLERKMSQFKFTAIYPIIIHHGPSIFSAPTELSELIMPFGTNNTCSLNLKAKLFDLNQIDVDKLLYGANVPEFVSVLKMMQAIYSRNGAIKAAEALAVLRPLSQNPKYTELIRMLLIFLAHCSKHVTVAQYNKIFYNDDFVDQGDKHVMTLADKLELHAEKRGREQGREEGREEKKAETCNLLRTKILSRLQFRFGELPQFVQKKVNRKADDSVLASLLESACIVQTIAEFAEEL